MLVFAITRIQSGKYFDHQIDRLKKDGLLITGRSNKNKSIYLNNFINFKT